MAENKKSFLLYCDLIHTVKKMPKEKAGELLMTILEYVNDENPVVDDIVVDLVFEPIKQQLKRDLVKYEKLCSKNSENAKKRWGKKDTVASDRMPDDAKHADNDTDNDSDTVTDIDNVIDKDIKVYSEEVHSCFENCLKCFDDYLRPTRKSKANTWLDTIDKLNRIDGIPFEVIEYLVKKAREDNFWSQNFLSLTKLRKKNGDGIKYIVVFNEKFKNNTHAKFDDKF